MNENPDHTRRWLINASGIAALSDAFAGWPSYAQVAGVPAARTQEPDESAAEVPISPVTTTLCGGRSRSRSACGCGREDEAAYPRHYRGDGFWLAASGR
jgi:hypothetical protein